MSRRNSLSRGLRRASSLKEGAFGMAAKFSGVSKAPSQRTTSPGRDRFSPRRGEMSPQVTKRGTDVTADDKKGNLAKPSGFDWGSSFQNPTRENAMPGGPQTARHCSIINNFSAEYAQSTTTTTAASGGNREELLGQRPARRKCRPRHDADAGCRNPIAERIPIVFLRTAPLPPDAPAKHTAMPRRTGSPP